MAVMSMRIRRSSLARLRISVCIEEPPELFDLLLELAELAALAAPSLGEFLLEEPLGVVGVLAGPTNDHRNHVDFRATLSLLNTLQKLGIDTLVLLATALEPVVQGAEGHLALRGGGFSEIAGANQGHNLIKDLICQVCRSCHNDALRVREQPGAPYHRGSSGRAEKRAGRAGLLPCRACRAAPDQGLPGLTKASPARPQLARPDLTCRALPRRDESSHTRASRALPAAPRLAQPSRAGPRP